MEWIDVRERRPARAHSYWVLGDECGISHPVLVWNPHWNDWAKARLFYSEKGIPLYWLNDAGREVSVAYWYDVPPAPAPPAATERDRGQHE